MSVRKNPEKAVPVLLERLGEVESHILKMHREDSSDLAGKPEPKLNEMKERLMLMNESMSRIKNWEKNVVEKFCDLEHALDDAAHKPLGEVRESLAGIDVGLGKLESYILREKESVTLRDGGMGPEKQQQRDEVGPGESVSEELGGGESVSDVWASVGAEDEIIKSDAALSLWASIHCPDGDEMLRMCLLCLLVFPDRALIKKRPLIYWWMGEGVVSNEEEGEKVLKQLLEQGFVIANKKQGVTLCPRVRRVLIPLAQKLGLFEFSALRDGGRPRSGEPRAFLWKGVMNESSPPDAHVLTVFNMDEQNLVGTKLEWLRGLHRLEVLQMGRWQDSANHGIEAADNYEQLLEAALASKKHLKYLSLRGISGIETLPAAAIGRLVSLRILDVGACHNLGRLPHTVSELSNLTHLDVSECYMLESMPKGLRHLLNLQVLKGFVVGTPGRGSCKIADLVDLKQLRKLGITVRRQGGQQLGSLQSLSALLSLTIFWMGDADAAAPVKLPTGLTRLDLWSVPFKAVPEWLQPSMLPNLKKLRINGGQLRKLILVNNNDVFKYPNVEFLRLQCLADLRIEKDDLVGLFPNYLYLEKTNCHEGDPDITLPPQAP